MLQRLLVSLVLLGGLMGCASYPLYEPVTLIHPRAGVAVTCGHWIWWECMVANYQDYQPLPDIFTGNPPTPSDPK